MIVKISDACSGCGICSVINNELFSVDEKAHLNDSVLHNFEKDCIEAALACPTGAIIITE